MLCICQFLPSKPTHSLVFQAFYKGDDPAIQSANVAHSRLPPVSSHGLISLLLISKEMCMVSLVSFWAPNTFHVIYVKRYSNSTCDQKQVSHIVWQWKINITAVIKKRVLLILSYINFFTSCTFVHVFIVLYFL